eukprot:5637250-Pleurochrysis_carterae.AAC.2
MRPARASRNAWSTATSAEEHAVLIVSAGPWRLCTLATRAARAEMEVPMAVYADFFSPSVAGDCQAPSTFIAKLVEHSAYEFQRERVLWLDRRGFGRVDASLASDLGGGCRVEAGIEVPGVMGTRKALGWRLDGAVAVDESRPRSLRALNAGRQSKPPSDHVKVGVGAFPKIRRVTGDGGGGVPASEHSADGGEAVEVVWLEAGEVWC